MANGNIEIGSKSAPRKTGQPINEHVSGSNGLPELRIDPQNPARDERPTVCGAMAQQCGDSGWGTQSTPQKLVHLIGYREPKVRPEPPTRLSPAKR